jgi:hypothetical protein
MRQCDDATVGSKAEGNKTEGERKKKRVLQEWKIEGIREYVHFKFG